MAAGEGSGAQVAGLREGAAAALADGGVRRLARDLVDAFEENDLLTYASALAFRVLFALIPLVLVTVAVLGFLELGEIWAGKLAPRVEKATSEAAFAVIDRNVEAVLTSKRTLWLSVGIALAVWFVSGAVRAAMGALNAVYDFEEDRSLARRVLVSIWLALAVAACLLGATLAVTLGGRVLPGADFLGGVPLYLGSWGAAVVLMALALGLLLRVGPARRQPVRWVSVGSALVIVAWVAASLLFGWYVTSVASYGSVYGNLASVIVLLTYLYLSSGAFLVGVQVDALVRERVAVAGRS